MHVSNGMTSYNMAECQTYKSAKRIFLYCIACFQLLANMQTSAHSAHHNVDWCQGHKFMTFLL